MSQLNKEQNIALVKSAVHRLFDELGMLTVGITDAGLQQRVDEQEIWLGTIRAIREKLDRLLPAGHPEHSSWLGALAKELVDPGKPRS